MLLSNTRDNRLEHSNPLLEIILFLSVNSFNSVKTFRKNSIETAKLIFTLVCHLGNVGPKF